MNKLMDNLVNNAVKQTYSSIICPQMPSLGFTWTTPIQTASEASSWSWIPGIKAIFNWMHYQGAVVKWSEVAIWSIFQWLESDRTQRKMAVFGFGKSFQPQDPIADNPHVLGSSICSLFFNGLPSIISLKRRMFTDYCKQFYLQLLSEWSSPHLHSVRHTYISGNG